MALKQLVRRLVCAASLFAAVCMAPSPVMADDPQCVTFPGHGEDPDVTACPHAAAGSPCPATRWFVLIYLDHNYVGADEYPSLKAAEDGHRLTGRWSEQFLKHFEEPIDARGPFSGCKIAPQARKSLTSEQSALLTKSRALNSTGAQRARAAQAALVRAYAQGEPDAEVMDYAEEVATAVDEARHSREWIDRYEFDADTEFDAGELEIIDADMNDVLATMKTSYEALPESLRTRVATGASTATTTTGTDKTTPGVITKKPGDGKPDKPDKRVIPNRPMPPANFGQYSDSPMFEKLYTMTWTELNDLNTRMVRPKQPGPGYDELGVPTAGIDEKTMWMYGSFVGGLKGYKDVDQAANPHPLRDGLTPVRAKVEAARKKLEGKDADLGDSFTIIEGYARSLSMVHYFRLDLLRRAGYLTLPEFDAIVSDLNESLNYAKDLYREAARLNPYYQQFVDSKYEYEDKRQRDTIPKWREEIAKNPPPR